LVNTELEQLRYPVGRFTPPESITPRMRTEFIADVAALPSRMRAAVNGLTPEQLAVPYRDGGWSSHQVAHHVSDSHMNAFIRFKLALTQDMPTICAYDQGKWAELADVRRVPVSTAVALLESLHERWVAVLQAMEDADFAREYFHPEQEKKWRLDTALALYAWHSRHHVAQITGLKARHGW
jgi:hypothetical protein